KMLSKDVPLDLRKEYAEIVLRQVELLNVMTRETLAFARGDRKLWIRKVYLRRFFEEIVDQLKRDMEGRHIRVELHMHDRGVARFDAHKIQRAVYNLARNAAEAIGDRGGTFSIEVDRDAQGRLL